MSATPSIEERKRSVAGPAASEDLDERARKRIKVGLSPRRPTAKATAMRPPDGQTLPLPGWGLALVLIGVLVVTAGLLAFNMTGTQPAWWPSLAAPGRTAAAAPYGSGDTVAYTLRVGEDFSGSTSALSQEMKSGEWRTVLQPGDSVYRMEVSPNHLAWSLLGLNDLAGYRLQTSALVSANPSHDAGGGFAGVIVRFQDARHFYLLGVDGQGRYTIQQQDGDETRVIVPWTAVPFLNAAGSANVLAVEDNGSAMRFLGNGMLLYDIGAPAYPTGYVGLAGGAAGQVQARIDFDWFQLYDIRPTDP